MCPLSASAATLSQGARIVAECVKEGLTVVPIPGPSSPITALCVSGMEHSAKQFTFGGFLPPQHVARCKQLETLSALTHPLVFFVPLHSLVSVLEDAATVLGRELYPLMIALKQQQARRSVHSTSI